MASIYKRKDSKGWRAVIHIKGHSTVCIRRERKEEAKDDAIEIERQTKAGQFKFGQHKTLYTFNVWLKQELIPNLDAETRKLLEGHGCEMLFLPPYSPDLNPIERYWANMKTKIREFLPTVLSMSI